MKQDQKYIAYYRVSTKKQGESGLGLESQINIVQNYYPNLINEYVEIKSGKDIKARPKLQEAIEECKRLDAILVVAKLDRLTRDVDDGRWVLEQLNGNLRMCDYPGKPDKMVFTIVLALAERERELIGIRTKAGFKAKRARGEKMGKPQFMTREGARKGAIANCIKATENEANIKAKAYAIGLRKDGLSLSEIAKQLNSKTFVTSKGGKWSPPTVCRLLKPLNINTN